MQTLQTILKILDANMETPTSYGWFHLLSFAVTILLSILLPLFYRKRSRDSVRKLVLWVSVTVALLEVYKQINFSFGYENGLTFDYAWYAFPFQFCSTPMYVGLLAGLTKKGKVHDAAMAYLGTYALFAGICVMFYPNTVFVDTIGINIQTMICHGSMIAIGCCLLGTGYIKLEHKTILKAIVVFAICVGIAAIMNEIAFRVGLPEGDDFNMFFISPHSAPSLPVYSLVQGVVPFPFCLVIYVAAFSLAAYIMLLVAMGIQTLVNKRAAKTAV